MDISERNDVLRGRTLTQIFDTGTTEIVAEGVVATVGVCFRSVELTPDGGRARGPLVRSGIAGQLRFIAEHVLRAIDGDDCQRPEGSQSRGRYDGSDRILFRHQERTDAIKTPVTSDRLLGFHCRSHVRRARCERDPCPGSARLPTETHPPTGKKRVAGQ